MIRLIDLLNIIFDIPFIIVDEYDNEYTKETVSINMIGRLVKAILLGENGIEIHVFPKEEYVWMEMPNGNIATYYTDGDLPQYDIIKDFEKGEFNN